MRQRTGSRLPALDGLRAIAVLLVITGHANYPIPGIPADLGVNLFFVLSGFLITRLLLAEQEDTGHVDLWTFYKRRAFRIFPAYYAFLFLSFAIDAVMGDKWPASLTASAISYTVNYFNATHGHPTTSIAHAWSLAVEEQFYLLWPVALMLMSRWGRLVQGTALIAFSALVWRTALMFIGAKPAYLYNAFETRMDCLAVGCLLAIVWHRQHEFAMLARRSWYPIATIASIIASRIVPSEAYHYSLGFTVEALLCGVLLVQVIHLSPTTGWRFLDHPVMRYLGMISYPMYLYHAIGGAFGRRIPGSHPGVEFTGSLVATILIATGSYYAIERPFLALRDRVRYPRTQPVPAAVRSR